MSAPAGAPPPPPPPGGGGGPGRGRGRGAPPKRQGAMIFRTTKSGDVRNARPGQPRYHQPVPQYRDPLAYAPDHMYGRPPTPAEDTSSDDERLAPHTPAAAAPSVTGGVLLAPFAFPPLAPRENAPSPSPTRVAKRKAHDDEHAESPASKRVKTEHKPELKTEATATPATPANSPTRATHQPRRRRASPPADRPLRRSARIPLLAARRAAAAAEAAKQQPPATKKGRKRK
ncbi:hypothetical protein AURDEDRAFT_125557 [Auricularia subglabra TFB-10046 SS5]|nr:hypothetical protein AURDEDRAFT_125557 [Auricularia subglabra TFB-10046 SS5]